MSRCPAVFSPLVLLAACGLLRAEFLRVELAVGGLDCLSCAASVEKTLRHVKGVESAGFDPRNAVAKVVLKPGNTVPIEDLRDALKGLGYTPGAAQVTVLGKARSEAGKWVLQPAALERTYLLDLSEAEEAARVVARSEGGIVSVEGSLPAAVAGGGQETLKVRALGLRQ